MGATCTRESSESFNLFASRLHVETGSTTAEEVGGSEQFNGNTDPALFEKIKTTAKNEVDLYTQLLEYIGKNRNTGLGRVDMMKIMLESPITKEALEGATEAPSHSPEELPPGTSPHMTNVLEIDAMALEFAWALSLAKVVTECCENAPTLKDSFATYTAHTSDKYNRQNMRGKALESLTWEPDHGALFLWLRDAM